MWPTPTPIPTPSSLPSIPIDPSLLTGNISDWILQGWHMFDSNPIATLVWFVVISLIIFAGIMSIRKHLEQL